MGVGRDLSCALRGHHLHYTGLPEVKTNQWTFQTAALDMSLPSSLPWPHCPHSLPPSLAGPTSPLLRATTALASESLHSGSLCLDHAFLSLILNPVA